MCGKQMSCIDDIAKAAEGVITKSELKILKETLAEKANRYDGADSLEKYLVNEAGFIMDNMKKAAQLEKRNRAMNLLAFKKMDEFIKDFDGDSFDAIKSRLVGLVGEKHLGRNSVDKRQKAILSSFMGDMIHALRKDDLISSLNSRTMDLDIAKEMFAIMEGVEPKSITGNERAFKMAKIFKRAQDAAVQVQNDLGANIRDLQGYIVKHGHDATRIRKAGLKQWSDDIDGWIDKEKTFRGSNAGEFLKKVHQDFAMGLHFKVDGSEVTAFKGPANLAKKISEHRVLHFKDAESWHAYNDKYGTANLTETVMWGLKRAADNAGLMETFGTNPRSMFDRVIKSQMEKAAEAGDAKLLDKIRGEKLSYWMDELDGTSSIPGNVAWARFGSGFRILQSLSKLGGAVLSSVTDLTTSVATLAKSGVPFLEGYGNSLNSVFKGRRTGFEREIADLINEGMDGFLGSVASRFTAQDTAHGKLVKMQDKFFKLSLLNWWTDAHKTGVAIMLSKNLATNRHLKWGELPSELQKRLNGYFDESSWEFIRKSAVRTNEGRSFLTPDAIRDIPDDALVKQFGEMSDRQKRMKRQELETSLRTYFVDQGDTGVITPGAEVSALAKGHGKSGSTWGEASRYFWQFKSFPVAFLQRGLGQFFPENKHFMKQLLNGKADKAGLAQMLIGTTIMGYVALQAKEFAKGREPRPLNEKTFMAAFIQGGGLGIYGDFLFGETSRFGKSALGTMAGPTWGTAGDVKDVLGFAISGDFKKAGVKLLNTTKSMTPFVNLFYTRAALDYALFYRMSEAINPGYLRRMEKNMKKNNDQTFYFNPSEYGQ